MGLDNGIILRNVNPKELATNKLVKVDNGFDDSFAEICYWRKCWGIRNAIVAKFHFNDDGGEYILDVEDIPVMIRLLFDFYGQVEWEDEADSIWEWEEFKETLSQQIMNLTWLYNYMLEHSDAEVIFYDSY